MKNLKKIRNFALIAMMAFFAISCNDDDNNTVAQDETVVDIAVANPDFSILVQALTKADLVTVLRGNGPFTVFAPTNQAFINAGYTSAIIAALPNNAIPALKEILLNHVVAGNNVSTSLSTGYVKTFATGGASNNTLSMFINTTNGVVINGGAANGGATVTTADIDADNGVIHVVDAIIGLPTIVNHAIANPSFGILVQALTRADQPDFAGILSGTQSSPFTVFAPTDAAFVALLGELDLNGLADVPQAVLENTLKYHVVAGANVLASTLMNNQVVNTFQGQSFTVQTPTTGARILDARGRTSSIIATDVQASNGVIHAIDKVLLPAS